MNVGKPSATKVYWLCTREITLEEGLTRAVSVGKTFFLSALICTRMLKVKKDPMSEYGKDFKDSSSSSILHQGVHTGERPFECKESRKTYVSCSGLCQHMEFHGEQNHECNPGGWETLHHQVLLNQYR